MLEDVRNLLYRRPELYELVYPEPHGETPRMCRAMFERFLGRMPGSILDVGCGTGRDLAALADRCGDCVGVDALPEMIAYARATRPHVEFQTGDMRSFRVGRTFEAILCMGSAFMYALTNDDVDAALRTFAAHARRGTLLILDINNAAACLPGGAFRPEFDTEIVRDEFTARAHTRCRFDRRRQLLIRERTWHIPGRDPVDDYCEYRLFFPAELEALLAAHRFRVLGEFDNMQLRDSDLSGARLYVAALYDGDEG